VPSQPARLLFSAGQDYIIYISEAFFTHRSSENISGLLVEWNKTSTEGFREFFEQRSPLERKLAMRSSISQSPLFLSFGYSLEVHTVHLPLDPSNYRANMNAESTQTLLYSR
jgi:hypothetical protein